MTEHKFTDEEIVHSLEICSSNGDCKECHINPHKGNYGFCTGLAIKAALDLINRQKAEIRAYDIALKFDAEHYRAEIVQLKAEIERFGDIGKMYSEIKAEAVKEFAERLKKYYASLNGQTAAGCVEYHIDQIAKEMTEDKTW